MDRRVKAATKPQRILHEHPSESDGAEMLMVGRAKDQFELWEENVRDDKEDSWNELLNRVQDYATKRRLEANLTKGRDAMDVGEVGGYKPWDHQWDPWNSNQQDSDGQWGDGSSGDIDALGKGKGGYKGKGKGKGMFSGQCFQCGEWGHSQRFCPKGKSKGKGQDSRQCYQCKGYGHIGRDCPINPYKGKGKGDKGGGKGKGLGAVDSSWGMWGGEQGSWDSPAQQWPPPPPPPVAAQDSGAMNMGGSIDPTCGSVERDSEWQVFTSRSRSKWDMRKAKRIMGCGECTDRLCNHQHGSVCSLERDSAPRAINAVDQFRGNWEKVSITVDSGAIDSVVPDTVAQGIAKRETAASKQGLKYRAANGTPIANEGEKTLTGYTNEGKQVGITMQVAKVTKPLGSVRAMVEANNVVVFDRGNSFIMDKSTRVKTKIDERNGAYVFDLWVPKVSGTPAKVSTGRYDALRTEEDSCDTGFVGLDDLF